MNRGTDLARTAWRALADWIQYRITLTAERMDSALDGFFICDECMEAFTTEPRVVDIPKLGLAEVCGNCANVLKANMGATDVAEGRNADG